MSDGIKGTRGPSKPGGGKRKNRDLRKQARRDAANERLARSTTCETCGGQFVPEKATEHKHRVAS